MKIFFNKIKRRLRRIIFGEKIYYNCICGKDCKLLRRGIIVNNPEEKHRITLGNNVYVLGELNVGDYKGNITIGDWTYIGDDSKIWSGESITIGSRVAISYNVNIHDTISHSLLAKERYDHMVEILTNGHPKKLVNVPSNPIVIEDDVWIGFNSIILKGVRIGKGAVIGAGTVITHDVPEYSIVVGNPQRIIGNSYK